MADDNAAANHAAATPTAQRAKTGDTVTIACKLPGGLLAELIDMDDAKATEVGRNGEMIKLRPSLGRVFFRGVARERRLERADDSGRLTDHEPLTVVAGGYGLTSGVDKDWADAWFAQNADYAPVKRGLIFKMSSLDRARSKASEQAELRSGLEPIDPKSPAKDRRNVGDVKPDEERHPALVD